MNILLTMKKYSPSHLEALAKPTRIIDNRLTINLHAVKEPYQKLEVNAVPFIRSAHNIAETLTKLRLHFAGLHTLSNLSF